MRMCNNGEVDAVSRSSTACLLPSADKMAMHACVYASKGASRAQHCCSGHPKWIHPSGPTESPVLAAAPVCIDCR